VAALNRRLETGPDGDDLVAPNELAAPRKEGPAADST
jgi:hypothetical protein